MPTFSVLDELEAAKGPLDAKGLAVILGISEKTLYKHADIPRFRIGGAIRFDPRVVSFWYRKSNPMVAAAGKAGL